MIIDFHTHTFPPAIAPGALAKMSGMSGTVPFTRGTDDALRASMKEAGIDLCVLLPVATNPQKVVSINDKADPHIHGGLLSFACIHPDMEGAEKEIKRVAEKGFLGVKIHPVYQNVPLDDPRYLRILYAAGENGLTVVTHTGLDIGFPGVVRCSPAQAKNALRQVGNVTLVLAHMGGWKNWEQVADALADTSAYLDTAFSLGRVTPVNPESYPAQEAQMLTVTDFCRLSRVFGSRRILFGTDSPWSDQRAEVEQIRALPLTEEEKENILFQNAKRLLKLSL